jgi:hypothetical protein
MTMPNPIKSKKTPKYVPIHNADRFLNIGFWLFICLWPPNIYKAADSSSLDHRSFLPHDWGRPNAVSREGPASA